MTLGTLNARKLIDELALDTPEILQELEAICFQRGASVRYRPLKDSEATLTVFGESGIITVNSLEPYPARQRFSIGHELGHFEIHRSRQVRFDCNEKDMHSWFARDAYFKMETEANEFAAELLMPEQLVIHEIKTQKPKWSVIEQLAETFGTSMSASARRFVELTEHACALIYFNSKTADYVIKSKPFQEQNYFVDTGKLDEWTEAKRSIEGKQSKKNMISVDANCWISNLPHWLNEEMLKEQAVFYPRLDMGMSLLWIEGDLLRF